MSQEQAIDTTTTAGEFDLQVPGGRLHARRFGPKDGPLVIGIPGLSANLKTFDYFAERALGEGIQLVALDLRGRGKSDITPAGTYGWDSHARDVVAVADQLGATKFSVIGSSMGGAVGMEIAGLFPGRLERLVLIDICGGPDPRSLSLIQAAVDRLGTVYPSLEAYIGLVRGIGTVEPWNEYWERYFEYDLVEVDGGVRARSDRDAVMEDSDFGVRAFAETDGKVHVYELWKSLDMPVLLVRGTRELMPGFGHIVPEAERDAFLKAVPTAELAEVDANHYGANMGDESSAAIGRFLEPLRRG
ncbi:MAG: hypothetical protein QOK05_739 [Chloroflexota bacterium]|jgi:pimeloyl-ACP methyl ester carboxylesterase|nr:hypothetical protein [Chloroflexota bacterium]